MTYFLLGHLNCLVLMIVGEPDFSLGILTSPSSGGNRLKSSSSLFVLKRLPLRAASVLISEKSFSLTPLLVLAGILSVISSLNQSLSMTFSFEDFRSSSINLTSLVTSVFLKSGSYILYAFHWSPQEFLIWLYRIASL